jgi:hypothetical protein
LHALARAEKTDVYANRSCKSSVADAGDVRKATTAPFNNKSAVFLIRTSPIMKNVVCGEDSILEDRLANRQILSPAN